MDILLFNRPRYEQLYNCSIYPIESIPLSQRQHPILGSIYLAFFLLCETLYIPCMCVIYEHIDNVSYKFLFAIGCLDMVNIVLGGLECGVLLIQGAVFCSYPTLIYVSGFVAVYFWYAETGIEMTLAVSRCLDTWWPEVGERMFSGWKPWVFIAAVSVLFGERNGFGDLLLRVCDLWRISGRVDKPFIAHSQCCI